MRDQQQEGSDRGVAVSDDGRERSPAVRIAVSYVVVAAAWVLVSDRLVLELVPGAAALSSVQTAKGLGFVTVTTLIIWWLVESSWRRWELERSRALERLGELRAREEEVRLREERILSAHRLDALGQLTSEVAHDFSSLCTAILGYADLLGEGLAQVRTAPDSLRDEAAQIRLVARQASHLARRLLTLSRPVAARMRVIDLELVVSDLGPFLQRVAGPAVAVRVDVDGPCPVLADPGQIEQILLNLVLNARDAMPTGGDLAISLGRRRRPGDDPPTHDVELVVRDRGVGIAAGDLERIWTPFYTTKPPGEGTGLGLAAVRSAVEHCHGRVDVDSRPGTGTVFTLVFPMAAGSPRPEAVTVDLPVAAAGGGRR